MLYYLLCVGKIDYTKIKFAFFIVVTIFFMNVLGRECFNIIVSALIEVSSECKESANTMEPTTKKRKSYGKMRDVKNLKLQS